MVVMSPLALCMLTEADEIANHINNRSRCTFNFVANKAEMDAQTVETIARVGNVAAGTMRCKR